jgi:CubicO group peptidase (beta-lactamase class C family)
LFLFVFFLAVQIGWAQSVDSIADFRQTLEKGFPSLHAPGLSAAVSVSNTIVWSEGFGSADLKSNRLANSKTIYRFASISKPISGVAVMQLVEQNKVNLDAAIQTYVPSFPKKSQGEITVRHLMTHTSGIRHYRGLEFLSNRRYKTVGDALKIFQNDPLEFKPGEKYQYSSYAYNILAGVVEKASGNTFRNYLKDNVFRPAGMASADLELLEEPVTNRCVQYVQFKGDFMPAPQVDLSCKWAGGGIAGTAEDLVKFCIALDEGKLLQAKTIDQMYQPGVLNDGSKTEYGLGWRLRKDAQGRRWVGHSGGATGGTTYFIHNPQSRVAVALLTNCQDVKGLDKLALQLGEMALRGSPVLGK